MYLHRKTTIDCGPLIWSAYPTTALDPSAGSNTNREKYEPDQLVMFSDV